MCEYAIRLMICCIARAGVKQTRAPLAPHLEEGVAGRIGIAQYTHLQFVVLVYRREVNAVRHDAHRLHILIV